jgi:hypothetical protein
MTSQKHAAHAAQSLTGVWHDTSGIRTEFLQDDAGWCAYTYLTRRGRFPSAKTDFDTVDQVRYAIARLEAGGHIRQPDLVPATPLTVAQEAGRQWTSLPHVLGAGVLLLLILVVGFSLMS